MKQEFNLPRYIKTVTRDTENPNCCHTWQSKKKKRVSQLRTFRGINFCARMVISAFWSPFHHARRWKKWTKYLCFLLFSGQKTQEEGVGQPEPKHSDKIIECIWSYHYGEILHDIEEETVNTKTTANPAQFRDLLFAQLPQPPRRHFPPFFL